MKTRSLGQSDLALPPIVYGAWAIGGWCWGGTDDEKAIQAMQTAAGEGLMAIDTAPIYGFGHSESLVGQALQSKRDSVLLLTKCGLNWASEEGPLTFPTRTSSGEKVNVRNNLRPASIRRECEESLKRLRTDVIDLYQCHWPDPETPIDPDAVEIPPYYPDHPLVRKDWAMYLESVQIFDKKVGQVLQRLEGEDKARVEARLHEPGRRGVAGRAQKSLNMEISSKIN